MEYLVITEEETTSSSRIFIKVLFQEIAEYMGLRLLRHVRDAELAGTPFMTIERAVHRLTGELGDWGSDTRGHATRRCIHIDGDEYVALLAAHRPRTIEWKADAHEHVFSYTAAEGGRAHSVYYPSLKSLQERLMVLRELGLGVALWELGSGLDYWWDLL